MLIPSFEEIILLMHPHEWVLWVSEGVPLQAATPLAPDDV